MHHQHDIHGASGVNIYKGVEFYLFVEGELVYWFEF